MNTVGTRPAGHRTRRRLAAGVAAAILLNIGVTPTTGTPPRAPAASGGYAITQSDPTPGPPWGGATD
jgi:hypothetical protein